MKYLQLGIYDNGGLRLVAQAPESQRSWEAGLESRIAAKARRSDPVTSHEAASSIERMTDKRQAVLDCFKDRAAPMTDEELREWYARGRYEPQSDSGLRTRRKELVDLGYLADTSETRTNSRGRQTKVWALNE